MDIIIKRFSLIGFDRPISRITIGASFSKGEGCKLFREKPHFVTKSPSEDLLILVLTLSTKSSTNSASARRTHTFVSLLDSHSSKVFRQKCPCLHHNALRNFD